MVNGRSLIVQKIERGTVIDHIPAGRSLAVLRLLGIDSSYGNRVSLVMNAESKKMGRKDIVKIEDRFLSKEETDKLALLAPTATINIVEKYVVVEKRKVEPPEVLEGIIRCTNPTCITRAPREPVKPRFYRRRGGEKLEYQCAYCGTIIREEEIVEQLIGHCKH